MFVCPIPIECMYIYNENVRDATASKFDINNFYIGKLADVSQLLDTYYYDSRAIIVYLNMIKQNPYILFYNNMSDSVTKDLQNGIKTKKFRETFIEPYFSVRFATNKFHSFPTIRKYIRNNHGYLYVEKRCIDTKIFLNSHFKERMRCNIRIFACCFPTYKDGNNFLAQLKALYLLNDLQKQ